MRRILTFCCGRRSQAFHTTLQTRHVHVGSSSVAIVGGHRKAAAPFTNAANTSGPAFCTCRSHQWPHKTVDAAERINGLLKACGALLKPRFLRPHDIVAHGRRILWRSRQPLILLTPRFARVAAVGAHIPRRMPLNASVGFTQPMEIG